jgi:hypothetical protein
MEVAHLGEIDPSQGLGQKIGLFLIVGLKSNPVARL